MLRRQVDSEPTALELLRPQPPQTQHLPRWYAGALCFVVEGKLVVVAMKLQHYWGSRPMWWPLGRYDFEMIS
jgi:hypothetical protein